MPFLNIARFLFAIVSGLGNIVGITYWIKLKIRNKREKVRMATLLALRDLIRKHNSLGVTIKIKKISGKIFGTNAYHVTVPHHEEEWEEAETHCIWAKEFLPEGYYLISERKDCLILELVDESGERVSNFCLALEITEKATKKK
jgi:hypothetical protein